MLVFIGLGLDGEGLSLKGLKEAQEADTVYAELYTSLIPELDIKQLEHMIGKPIKIVGREIVEVNPEEILKAAKVQKVAFLVPGDPMVATTHVDLRIRAAKADVVTRVIHGASIISAAAGSVGLQSYKFGPSATIPFQDNTSSRPYEILTQNSKMGLHTILLLDIREGKRAMTAKEGIDIMLGLEEKLRNGVFTLKTLAVIVARAGSEDKIIKADFVQGLRNQDFGPPPHVIVVPGKLHFVEAEALRVFAGASAEALQ